MSRKRILVGLERGLPPHFKVNRNVLYHDTYRYVLRGILVEGTAYKATWRIRNFTLPLFRTYPLVHLNYSVRIPVPGDAISDDFSDTDEEIAAAALRAIQSGGLLDDIMAGCSPSQFLQRYGASPIEMTGPVQSFDLACASALCGDIATARQRFLAARAVMHSQAERYGPTPDDAAFGNDIETALRVLDNGPAAFQAHMDQAARAAAFSHGFCLPMMSAIECPASALQPGC